MQHLHFESNDLAETEDFLVNAYVPMRIAGHSGKPRTQIDRHWLGPLNVDKLSVTFDLSYTAQPLERLYICRVHSGYIEGRLPDAHYVDGPGDVALVSLPGVPCAGRVSNAVYDLTMLDLEYLNRVAAPASRTDTIVQLTDRRPTTDAAGRRLAALLTYFHDHLVGDSTTGSSPLVVDSAITHLASTVLSVFPSNAQHETTTADHRDSTARSLRKAMQFIHDNAHTPLSVVDIANHVAMTPRGVQYMFRRELDCTPMNYVRRVRLDHAHRDLLDANPTDTSVGEIAARWGFIHAGRFARSYRQTFGRAPYDTLNA